MRYTLTHEPRTWQLREPFAISRGVKSEAETLIVTLVDNKGRRGRGEASGVPYLAETTETMAAQIDAVRSPIEAGVTRAQLLSLLPAGGARCGVDSALWDLEAKSRGISVFELAAIAAPIAVTTVYSIGIRSPEAYEASARERSSYPVLKLKVGQDDPLSLIAAARRGAPDAKFIVDPNQAWTVKTLKKLAPALVELGVVLLEQPIPAGTEAELDGYRCPVSLCADELVQDIADLDKAKGRFEFVNIKLDKTGGLTEALHLADVARAAGFKLMVGCMGGSSLSMAPALVLAQQCAFVDLDGPLFLSSDWPDGLVYKDGQIQLPGAGFWG